MVNINRKWQKLLILFSLVWCRNESAILHLQLSKSMFLSKIRSVVKKRLRSLKMCVPRHIHCTSFGPHQGGSISDELFSRYAKDTPTHKYSRLYSETNVFLQTLTLSIKLYRRYLWSIWPFWLLAPGWRPHCRQRSCEDAAGMPIRSTCGSLPLQWLYTKQRLCVPLWSESSPEHRTWIQEGRNIKI